jgi:hypothetical protein
MNTIKFQYCIFLGILILASSCNRSKTENDLDEEQLVGKVKSVRTTHYSVKSNFGKIEKSERFSESWDKDTYAIFDENSMILQKTYFQSDGKVAYQIINEYDNKGKKTKYSFYFEGELSEFFTYKYDENGLLNESDRYTLENGLIWVVKHKYDQRGFLIEEDRHDKNGNLIYAWYYKLDKKGNKIEEKLTQFPSEETYLQTFSYDKKSNLTERIDYSSDGRIDQKFVFEYNKFGIISSETKYGSNGSIEGKIKTFEYQVDNQGNWTHKIQYENNLPFLITEREIQYY